MDPTLKSPRPMDVQLDLDHPSVTAFMDPVLGLRNFRPQLEMAFFGVLSIAYNALECMRVDDPEYFSGLFQLMLGTGDSEWCRNRFIEIMKKLQFLWPPLLDRAKDFFPVQPNNSSAGLPRCHIKIRIGNDHVQRKLFRIRELGGAARYCWYDIHNEPPADENEYISAADGLLLRPPLPPEQVPWGWLAKDRDTIYLFPALFGSGSYASLDLQIRQGDPLWKFRGTVLEVLMHELCHSPLLCSKPDCDEAHHDLPSHGLLKDETYTTQDGRLVTMYGKEAIEGAKLGVSGCIHNPDTLSMLARALDSLQTQGVDFSSGKAILPVPPLPVKVCTTQVRTIVESILVKFGLGQAGSDVDWRVVYDSAKAYQSAEMRFFSAGLEAYQSEQIRLIEEETRGLTA
ncbi:uncharacterized protein AB675_1364 [Cyphellophora attinorum]|uniref:Uncharacterized protein n=1 Tax=Cyphellophora attinorum TaxID=1664694 RepID=A0A0N1H344_9EURO|nr:uncharacterized protein AB675_1364 [Phialophora attinorum]KPI35134.1 hypothetical protein AB675_1364 [Phialophora attinorum]